MIRNSPEQYFENAPSPENNLKPNYLPLYIIGALIFGGICVVAIVYSKRK